MPRFVVLEHDWPFLHWDLLLEMGEELRSWRLQRAPAPDSQMDAAPIAPHRLFYLDYEGPVSGGRGQVTRWDDGTYEIITESSSQLTVLLHGRKIVFQAHLRESSTDPARWSCTFLPTAEIPPANRS